VKATSYLIAALLLCAGCGTDAAAKPRPLLKRVMFVQLVSFVPTDAAYYDALDQAAALVSELGITLELVAEYNASAPVCPTSFAAFWATENYSCNRVAAQPYWQRSRTTLVLAAALDGGYFAGMASRTCEPVGGVAVINSKPEARKMTVAIAHELGHLLGSGHDSGGATNRVPDPPNIMLPDAGRYWSSELHFSARSKVWVVQCLTRLQRRYERRRK